MKKFAYLCLLFYIHANGQGLFNWPEEPITYKLVKIDGLSQGQLYNGTTEWIEKTIISPDEVIKKSLDIEKVRFQGIKEDLFEVAAVFGSYFFDGRYTIEVTFKDGEYKFEPISLERYIHSDLRDLRFKGRWLPISLDNPDYLYNRKGKLRKHSRNLPEAINGLFNSLNRDLKAYLTGVAKEKKDY
ncbi:DUF4468 domain-containing protein [Aestuariivivens sediminis]|uniref:DUF4468 domain-containing protein n=1 Tax=Aestuariivivens sediminis TaxID=2913557 RepID=UPI001F599768|nr:DUF4468 domain-containing protein [Aestuariivivens sediminis]